MKLITAKPTKSFLFFAFLLLAFSLAVPAQEPAADARNVPSTYVLGPDDQLTIRALDVDELGDKPVRIDMRGNINLPMVGRLQAAGLTPEQLEAEITTRLKRYLQNPQVVVSIAEFRSQPISILGSVTTPGVHQLQGHKTLFEMLSSAGGLRPDAGHSIKITRRLEWGRIPLPNAADDPSGQFTVATVGIKSIMDAKNPQDNIEIKPNDVISVPRADLIYVIGSVRKSGGFVLGERETLSALQILSLAEGLDRTAAPQNAKILRAIENSPNRTEIPVDLKKILTGKSSDLPLQADDILFVPSSASKSVALRTLEAAIGMSTGIGTGLVIYRR